MVKYFPFGDCWQSQGTLPTDRLFTGQRLDDNTGLYYYNARYYDPTIGRFISADTIVPNPANPQSLNRYSYCLNNPLKYIDPSGHDEWDYEFCPPSDYDEYIDYLHRGGDCSYSHWHSGQAFVNSLVSCFLESIAAGSCQTRPSYQAGYADAGWGSCEDWTNGFLSLPDTIKESFIDLFKGYSTLAQTNDGRMQLAAEGFFIIISGGKGSTTSIASQFIKKWPKTASEMDDLLGVQGSRIPDLASTPGRNKVIWQISDNLKVTYEQHPYHSNAPVSHSGPHYHLDYPGSTHAGPYLPGDPLP
jgi:RHS repeat-associated protein